METSISSRSQKPYPESKKRRSTRRSLNNPTKSVEQTTASRSAGKIAALSVQSDEDKPPCKHGEYIRLSSHAPDRARSRVWIGRTRNT